MEEGFGKNEVPPVFHDTMFLLKVIAEYLRKTLVFPGQNSDEQPSIAITASTGKAACNVEGTTVHSAFKLPRHILTAYCVVF